jgi:catalase
MLKLAEIASRINAHLKRFERDPVINKDRSGNGLHDYFWAGAGVAGRYVSVHYVSYQGHHHLTKADALRYLQKLDAGYVGRHWQALKEGAK